MQSPCLRPILFFLLFFLLGVSLPAEAVRFGAGASPPSLDQETRGRIIDLLAWREATPPVPLEILRDLSHEEIQRLYQERDYRPLWHDGYELRPAAGQLLEYLRNAGEHGLCPENYLLGRLEKLVLIRAAFFRHGLPPAADNLALLDLLLSQAFLAFTTHILEGQVDPALVHVDWRARRRKADLVKLLQYALEQNRLGPVLNDLLPSHAGYHRLVEALTRYRQIAALGGWPRIPAGPSLRPGEEDPRLPVLRQRLMTSGDLHEMAPAETVYDLDTVAAVRDFQARHGLLVDGIVGPETLAALNVSAMERVRQIELNLERWRWLPKILGEVHLRVNIADFSLALYEDGRAVMTMPVIVGTAYRKTPVFSDRMTYLEFAPYWTVPPTILREDKLPKIRRDPGYLVEHHFRILKPRGGTLVELNPEDIDWQNLEAKNFPGLLRMEPGPWNPLGRVKFMFPNEFNVYLHDTNEPHLFRREVRSLSSGCIRIRRPYDLAQYLVENLPDMNCEKMLDLLDADRPRQVPIKPLPVHILYWTAWIAEDGSLQFREDIYLRDLDLEVALADPAYRTIDQLRLPEGIRRLPADPAASEGR